MKKYHLGEFEELVVLAIGILNNKAYSVTIKDEIEERTARTVSLGALHTALKRMEEKGYLRSFPGDSTDERGGRPKRYFEITGLGKKAVQHSRDTRAEFWKAVPKNDLTINPCGMMMANKPHDPPRTLMAFFRWYCDPTMQDYIEGDLKEIYSRRLKKSGKRAADMLFVVDVLLLRIGIIRPMRGINTLNNYGMIKSYFKIGWRNIVRGKGYSFLNISGLAIGLTAAMLILLWVQNETSFDRFHAKADRIYQLFSRDLDNGNLTVWGYTPALMAPELLQSYPDVEDAVRQRVVFFLLKAGQNRFNEMGAFTDPGFLRMFSFPLLHGTGNALDDDAGIVLSRAMAIKLFGTLDCIGQTVQVNGNDNFKVTAVLEDMPQNTNFENFTFLLPWSYFTKLGWDRSQTWSTTNTGTFVSLKDPNDADAFDLKLNGLLRSHLEESDSTREVFSHPLTKLHLYSKSENGKLTGGRHETVMIFSIIAGLIVIMACINFINLSTARSEKRAREVGVRKIAGAYRSSLVMQFLVESSVLVTFAFVISLILIKLSLPVFNLALNASLELEFLQADFWVYVVVLLLFTGIMAGAYPAFFLAACQPIKTIKGTMRAVGSAFSPRKVLVVIQFTAAIVLCICAVMVQRQIQFAENRNVGYNPKDIHYEFMQGEIPVHFDAIKNELLASGAVTSVTRTFAPIVWPWGMKSGLSWQGSDDADKTLNFVEYGADADMSKTFDMQILQGRDLDIYLHPTDTAAVMLNESAVSTMRLSAPVGEFIRDGSGKNWQVVGVVKDFIIQSPYKNVSPMIIHGWQDRYGVLNYRFSSTNSDADNRRIVEAIFKKNNPEYPVESNSAEDYYQRKFATERQTGKLASGFAALSILVSCLGLVGLASYLAESRTKEIGVRKVLGASSLRIVAMLSMSFIKLVVIAIVIASPLAWYFASNWLDSYEYRVPVGVGVFILTGIVALLIALVTVSTQAMRAALANPVRSLRSE
jgi:ABC-type antimicrobial peptide transport system permease subunit/DNA-binding PadR family transcriptional regulator